MERFYVFDLSGWVFIAIVQHVEADGLETAGAVAAGCADHASVWENVLLGSVGLLLLWFLQRDSNLVLALQSVSLVKVGCSTATWDEVVNGLVEAKGFHL